MVAHTDKVEVGGNEDEGAAGGGGAEDCGNECGGEIFEARIRVGGGGEGIETGESLLC